MSESETDRLLDLMWEFAATLISQLLMMVTLFVMASALLYLHSVTWPFIVVLIVFCVDSWIVPLAMSKRRNFADRQGQESVSQRD